PQDFQHCKVSLGKPQQPARAGSRRRARLTTAAAALAACEPAEAPVAAALEAAFPEAPSEQDPGIMLNTAARGTNLLGWFLLLCRGSGFQIFIVITSQICFEK
ncbi:hypothetical protein ZWY2020_051048, partial [Hordeum vulgare]